jgi:succinate dehydrogenase / fumarate reductase, flavoprotein subunit
VVAEATVLSARQRRESRGAHQRYDYPKLDPKKKVNFMIILVPPGDLQVTSKPLPEVSNELAEWVLEEKEQSLQDRLLE